MFIAAFIASVETGNEKGVLTSFIHQQRGHSENQDSNNGSLRVEGQILYKVDDSLSVAVNYTADERGYRPKVRWIFQQKPAKNVTQVGLRGPGGPGGPATKTDISSHALGSLLGGNG